MLDRTGPVPLHHQVRHYILEQIRCGQWPVGSQIPTEHVLSQTLGVSRATVIHALSELTRQGMVDRRQGKGTFVLSPRLVHGPLELKSFTAEHGDKGLPTFSRVLTLAEQPCETAVAQALQLEVGDLVVYLRRIRYAGPESMGIQDAYLPARMFPGLVSLSSRLEGSLYALLEEAFGIVPELATETFEPARFTKAEASFLECDPKTLAFLVERLTMNAVGKPFEFVRSKMRGDRYRYSMQLRRSHAVTS